MELSTACVNSESPGHGANLGDNRPGCSQAPKVTRLLGLTPWMIDRNRGFGPSAEGVGHLLWKAVHPVGSPRPDLEPTATHATYVHVPC